MVTLDYGWTRQTTERLSFSGTANAASQGDLTRQVNAIDYVLDTYLPWNETANRFLENVADPARSTNQDSNSNFFNRFYAVQQYLKKLHGKLYLDNPTFTDLSVWSPVSDIPNNTPANTARNTFFNDIRADVNNKATLGLRSGA